MYYGMYDWTYLLVIVGFIFTMIASSGVKATFNKYSTVNNARGLTGAQAARQILDANGLRNIRLEHIQGSLTDHYSPKEGVIRLSDSTYNSQSIGAIGVAAHECGHAIQHKVGYVPIKVRNGIVPFVNVCNRLSMPLFIIGMIMGGRYNSGYSLAMIGALLFGAVFLFQLVTLPTETNASKRALETIKSMGMLEGSDYDGAKKVLIAAAMTYVAAVASTALQFLRLLILANRNRRN